jgi:hypothetical protein
MGWPDGYEISENFPTSWPARQGREAVGDSRTVLEHLLSPFVDAAFQRERRHRAPTSRFGVTCHTPSPCRRHGSSSARRRCLVTAHYTPPGSWFQDQNHQYLRIECQNLSPYRAAPNPQPNTTPPTMMAAGMVGRSKAYKKRRRLTKSPRKDPHTKRTQNSSWSVLGTA